MDHNDIRHKLSEYIDGAVSPAEAAAIDAHLATCTECAEALRELRKTIEAVKQIEEVEPPVWMTSKIMARVREQKKTKKSFWHHLFYPLAVKIPIQTVAVLFLTITAYYMYRAPSVEKYAEAPAGQPAKEEARPAAPDVLEQKTPEMAAPRKKKAEPAPGYKSLDMKYAYEKPAAPVPQEQPAAAAPAPAKQEALQVEKDEAAQKRAVSPRAKAAAPVTMADEAGPSAGAARRQEFAGKEAPAVLMSQGAEPGSPEAEAQLAVTEQFSKHDLPGQMNVKGLTFSVRKYRADLPDLQWLPQTSAYRARPCSNRYVVDVDLSGQVSKYLYCYDRSKVVLLGVYELQNGSWSERK